MTIRADNLTFTYPGAENPSVKAVSFEAPSGSVFGLLGPSGAGKSTLQKILIRLLPLQQGEVVFDGESLRGLGRDFFDRIGVSFEQPNLFPRLTGLENLTCFSGLNRRAGRDPRELLHELGLGESLHKFAEDYSKGMKQRLVFARALLHRPDYLFLDEPTSGLDPATADRVMEMIRSERNRGATIILTTHNMRVADSLCDTIGLIHEGRLVAKDSPRALKLAHGERAVRVERRAGSGQMETRLFATDDPSEIRQLQALIESGDFETLHSAEATLERVFLQLTGQGLQS